MASSVSIIPQNSSILNIKNTLFDIEQSASTTQKSVESISKLIGDNTERKTEIAKKTSIFKSLMSLKRGWMIKYGLPRGRATAGHAHHDARRTKT